MMVKGIFAEKYDRPTLSESNAKLTFSAVRLCVLKNPHDEYELSP